MAPILGIAQAIWQIVEPFVIAGGIIVLFLLGYIIHRGTK